MTNISKSKNSYPAINEFVIKLASRCNINCSYCYWFNDPLVMNAPKILTLPAQLAFVTKLKQHINQHQLKQVRIAFHGGEPTLFPKARFAEFCQQLRDIELATGCQILLAMQSNALLIDNEWCAILKNYQVNLGISLDGTQQLHDKLRIDHKGRGTYQATVDAIERIRNAGIDIYILTVASEDLKATQLVEHLVHTLGVTRLDVLMPHLHHQHQKASLSKFWIELFDLYIDELVESDVEIRIFDDLMLQILGGNSGSQGHGFISTVTLMTNGGLECIDDLRMIDGISQSCKNILEHDIQEIIDDPLWREIYHASLALAEPCESCDYKASCGGGPLVTRWSDENRFANVSSYCGDYQNLISHIQQRINPLAQHIIKDNSPTNARPISC
ncbi:radical SAM protein [Aliikangiella sp. IMCC44653]